MGTQNSNPVAKKENSNVTSNVIKTSSYDYFLKSYKSCKTADSFDLESHKVLVRNFLNAHNREFKEIAPIKNWLAVLNSDSFFPRKTSSKKYSLFFTLQALNKELKKEFKKGSK